MFVRSTATALEEEPNPLGEVVLVMLHVRNHQAEVVQSGGQSGLQLDLLIQGKGM